jgi:hypothetical protein
MLDLVGKEAVTATTAVELLEAADKKGRLNWTAKWAERAKASLVNHPAWWEELQKLRMNTPELQQYSG